MGELGNTPRRPPPHRRTRRRRGLVVIAVGDGAEGIAEVPMTPPHFPVLDDAAKWLTGEVKPGDVVLFKGSRTADG
jgi:UDP-N-acetylmuramoyl-tripeptide--D-alanyl-D-alanine ligase